MKTEELARAAYEAFHKEYKNDNRLNFEDIPEEQYFAWQAATAAVQQKLLDECESSLTDISSMAKYVLGELKIK